MKENVVKKKSFEFAVRIVKLYKFLVSDHREYVLSKQVLRCGTALGEMIREAEQSESRADFVHKLAIAQKEINETIYWLELLEETNYPRLRIRTTEPNNFSVRFRVLSIAVAL